VVIIFVLITYLTVEVNTEVFTRFLLLAFSPEGVYSQFLSVLLTNRALPAFIQRKEGNMLTANYVSRRNTRDLDGLYQYCLTGSKLGVTESVRPCGKNSRKSLSQ